MFHIYTYNVIYIYIFINFSSIRKSALNAEQHSSFLRRCLINSLCDSEFHIHGVICMIVRHRENVLRSATYSHFYVSY